MIPTPQESYPLIYPNLQITPAHEMVVDKA